MRLMFTMRLAFGRMFWASSLLTTELQVECFPSR